MCIFVYVGRGIHPEHKKRLVNTMKQIFRTLFWVADCEIIGKVIKYLNKLDGVHYMYESCGGHVGGYTMKVWNLTEVKKRRLFLFMKEVCGKDFRFNSSTSLGFIK